MEGEEPEGIPSRFTVERVLAARDDGMSVTFTLSLLYSAQESHSSLFHGEERRPCHGRWAYADNILSYVMWESPCNQWLQLGIGTQV